MDLVLGPSLKVVFEKAASPILEELLSFKGLKKEIKKLRNLLPIIQAVIADAEERQLRDERVQIWLRKLRQVVYDADDFLDELTTEALRRQMEKKLLILILKPFPNYIRTSHKLKDIRERLDDIAKEISNFQFRDAVVYRRFETAERRQTGPYLDESTVFGRENDVEKMVELLVSSSSSSVASSSSYPNRSENISYPMVLPIVGIGAIGKTTVSQLAYNDPRVEQHFDLKIWISVYDNFSVRKLINDILDSISNGNRRELSQAQLALLQSQLQESLCGKRYLIVLDDVWIDKEEEWDKLRSPLRYGADGSKIIVTTRSQSVASMMGTMPSYLLEPLSHDACWTLFKQHAFPQGEEEEAYPKLVPIGKEIVNMCGGVPLAAKILGSMMRTKREEREWSHVLTSRLSGLDDSSILPTLKLSYNHLPPHLKQCFRFLSVLPSNYVINKEKLIHQWIAEGLIQSPGDAVSSKKMEDTANEYFNDLRLMCFFQSITKCDDTDDVIEFKLHDLIHELALSVVGDEVIRLNDNSSHDIDALKLSSYDCNARHASLECSIRTSQNLQVLFSAMPLRSVNVLPMWPGGAHVEKVITSITSRQRRLRMLNLSGCDIENLHKSIGGLMHLRYLDLSNTLVRKLPETICHLFNLQTLNLSGCYVLEELPRKISNLSYLRHLNIKDCTRLTRMPPNIGKLKNLQTLPIFIVGNTVEESLLQLKHLELRGELKVKCLENVTNVTPDLCLAYKQLYSLVLSWGNEDVGKSDLHSSRQTAGRHPGQNAENVLACLQPNSNLRSLSIIEYPGVRFPPWMNHGVISKLTKLEFINCRECENLPTLGKLPLLKVLIMQGMDAVVKISSEFYGKEGRKGSFCSLTELTIKDFPGLQTWESMDGEEAFPCLNRLTITKCPRLSTMPWFPSLQHLELNECNTMILTSAKELNSLSTLSINNFPECYFLPKALLQNNLRLTSLTVSSCPRLTSVPENLGYLTALKSLVIRWCEELETLPPGLRNLTSLQTLEIIECSSLISLPEESIEGLESLRSFSIENCYNLTSLPMAMKHLKALEHLAIMYCPSLVHLPDGLHDMSALRSLNIVGCDELVSLPEGLNVKMLQNLEIRSCPKLTELPEWVQNLVSLRSLAISDCQNIKYLPEGLQHLTALQHLSIIDCPDLEERCKEGGGDWHKICHIGYRKDGAARSSS